ncbi:Na+/H+ antiporter family protein [Wolinella succinogenes]|uniref:PUTATIVE INTEGRAL MEMBRANE PROTEIN n=1 Tax=Wolinella succinogenes (strain ATCC 29543 / DSM 1740 / CCUG 13145 / JCM 31913 / LMG 7466 / NCTC 11488 / FDC 602W) TaxID=273121 RepID=Q7MAN5_WOLSU|nr:Na+/H+ antiporter NhaC family protein [Wolinella succinogenes]CAE09293.1 PUTATIVE INTEGRAL MEMBRANE PROTEIN [Wolinella succinogenes]
MLLTNPVLLSVVIMSVLCLFRLNVLLAILIAALCAGLAAGMSLPETIKILIQGMQGNLETALSYILLGALAVAISQTHLTTFLIRTLARTISNKAIMFTLSIAFIACFSQNLIPVHIAFIPILIPPLLPLMNRLKIDRRAVACALTFGLKAPYVAFSVGFGLIFTRFLKDQMAQNGIPVEIADISSVMWIGGVAMVVGLLAAVLFAYARPREYATSQNLCEMSEEAASMGKREWATLAGALVAFIVQLTTNSLPLGGLLGLAVMVILGGIPWKGIDSVMEGGMKMMAFIAFIMLVAAGYGSVLRETGAIEALVSATSALAGGKLGGAMLMLLIGLLVTMGIGTSFGTIPIIAAIYCPLALELGFSVPAIILLIGIAAALGDAGSPASDSTLGPTSGLNADGQHDHIWDTCVPTFLFYSIPLMIFGVFGALWL